MKIYLCAVAASMILLAGCMKSPEEQYAGYMESGASYFAEKEYSSAALEFRNAARVNPDVAEPQFQLAKTYLEMGRLEECYRAVRVAVDIEPDHADATLLLAQILSRLGNAEDARAAEGMLETVLDARPDDAEALFSMALTRARLGSAEDAESYLEHALQSSPSHLRSAVTLARIRAGQGDRAGAEEILRAAVSDAEDSRPASLALAQFLLSTGRTEEAVRQVDDILSGDPEYGPALLARGLLHLRAGERDLAEAIYKRASALPEPAFKTAYARVLTVNGKLREASAEVRRLYDADPKDREMRTMLLSSLLREGRIDDAEAILDSAIQENDRDFDARLQRSEIYLRSGRPELARTDVDVALEVQATSAQAHYLLAKILEASQNPMGSRQELGEALRLQNDFLLARLDMAQSLLRSTSKRSALDLLDEAPEAQKDNPRLVSGRIWALIALEDYDQALASIADARTRLGELRDLRLQEGVVYAARGNTARAQPLLADALTTNPQDLRAYNALVAAQVSDSAERGLATARNHANAYPDNSRLQLAAGTWLLRGGKREEARVHLERAVAKGDPSHQAQVLLANLDEAEGRDAAAMQKLQGILAKQANHVEALTRLAMLQEKHEQYDEADKNYRAVLAIAPQSPAVLNNLAYLITKRNGNLDEALRFAQLARENSPDGYPATGLVEDTLGWVHYLRGSYSAAVLSLQSAATSAPRQPLVRYHLAMAYAKNGDTAAAREAYAAGMAMDPALPEAREVAALLE